jgi:hypothetical protein
MRSSSSTSKACEWLVVDEGLSADLYRPCGKPARWMIGDIPVCAEHYDLIHGIGKKC